MRAIDLLVPGDPATATGGYVYDRRMLEALAALGWKTAVHGLDTSFPAPTAAATKNAAAVLARIPSDHAVVIDGLALTGLADVLAAEAGRLPWTALVHHPLALETGLNTVEARALRAAEQASLAHAERIIATSEWTARALGEYDIAAERIVVAPPGTDPAPPGGGTPGGDGPLKLLCVGTLTPRKGHAVLFDALGRLRELPWQLDCAGSDTRNRRTAAALRRQLAQLGLEQRVALLGETTAEALAGCYARADLFVLASYLEGYGMALAEALARGIPIVATTAGAIPETVPAEAARLVPPGDSAALAEALAELIRHDDVRRRLAAGAAAAGARLPTWQEAGERFAAALHCSPRDGR